MVTTTRENTVCLLAPGGNVTDPDQRSTEGPCILIVEDDTPTLRLERIILEEEGYQVTVVRSGEEALQSLATSQPSLILLDIGLPGVDGFDTCREIRRFSLVPIIMVTGRDCLEDKVHGMDVGADDYVTKPFLVHELAARVKVLLRRTSQTEESDPSPSSPGSSAGAAPAQTASPAPAPTPSASLEPVNGEPLHEEPVNGEPPREHADARAEVVQVNPPEPVDEEPPSRQVSWTLNDNWEAPAASASPETPGDEPGADEEERIYEGTVRLMVESHGSIRQLMNFVGELRQNPQYRLLRLVANQHKEGMDVWLGLREPVPLKSQLLEMSGVVAVEAETRAEEAQQENEHLITVQLGE